MFRIFVLLCFVLKSCVLSQSQYNNCDFVQKVAVNQTYYVYSPGYPKHATRTQCRWIATCPEGYNCKLHCPEVNLTQSSGCIKDKLLVSRSGDSRFSAAEQYCGRGSLTAISFGQRISVGLMVSQRARIRCTLTAVPSVDPNCNCGCRKLLKNRIVGGEETDEYEYPAMAGVADLSIHHIFCGGVILDPKHVLTAAHCLATQKPDNIAVVVGEKDVSNAVSYETQGYIAEKFIIHPKYTSLTFDYDIAIIVLAREIIFGEHVGPVCLPFKFTDTDMAGKYLIVLGWGTLFPGGPTSDTLQETRVKAITQEQCRAATPYLTDRQICTYTPGKDSCQHDSGGPLLYSDPSTDLLFTIGISSHGRWCAATPAVNTRVTSLLNWITSSTGRTYCRK